MSRLICSADSSQFQSSAADGGLDGGLAARLSSEREELYASVKVLRRGSNDATGISGMAVSSAMERRIMDEVGSRSGLPEDEYKRCLFLGTVAESSECI